MEALHRAQTKATAERTPSSLQKKSRIFACKGKIGLT
jgi:hypothetical protein